MTKWVLSRPGAPWDYPTLGFRATVDGAILDGSLFSPALSVKPDAFWTTYGGGSAETGITRYASATAPEGAGETEDGTPLVYDADLNTYVARPYDTGWRDMASGAWYVRRTGGTVFFRYTLEDSDPMVGLIPEGFRPAVVQWLTGNCDGSPVVAEISPSGDFTGSTGTITNAPHFSGSWPTDDDWPDPLPGVAYP